jgi:putative addiction module component (TIGR02574 family)
LTQPAVNLDDLTPDEQLDHVLEEIWDRLSQHPAGIPLADAQQSELDKRLDALEDDVRAGRPLGRPWSEIRERLKSR